MMIASEKKYEEIYHLTTRLDVKAHNIVVATYVSLPVNICKCSLLQNHDLLCIYGPLEFLCLLCCSS